MSKEIFGNLKGIRDTILSKLAEIYDMNVGKNNIISQEIIDIIVEVSNTINREINVSIDRDGNVVFISIGDHSSVTLNKINVSDNKLSGIRVIHTHPGGNPHLSNIDISALYLLKLDLIVSIGINNDGITGYEIAYLTILNENLSHEKFFKKKIDNLTFMENISYTESSLRKLAKTNIVEDDRERAILVGVDGEILLKELQELAKACNIDVVDKCTQKIKKVDIVYFIGIGKVKELALLKQVKNANLIIFDDELSGVQLKNLEETLGCRVIDRTTLILEIFARRAKTREAKIQIDLARLKYVSQRLIGFGNSMSRMGGGSGFANRGSGETKLEIDRRNIKDNIAYLRNELEKVRKYRETQRMKREASGISKVSLVGYTNVGKSTIRNLFSSLYSENTNKEEVFVENMLFATLDTTTRSIILPDKRNISLTDTVGFIRKLPHDLVEAFKSTLEEVIFSDLLLHVVDASSKEAIDQIKAVEQVLDELKCKNKDTIIVLNKIDKAESENIEALENYLKDYDIIKISAKQKINIDELLNMISEKLKKNTYDVKLLIPYTNTEISASLHRNAVIKSENYIDEGIVIEAILQEKEFNLYKNYTIEK